MILEKLLLINYRNYPYQLLHFHPKLNVVVGDNAQGKTNLLESVYLTARGRSFKNVTDKDFIRFGEKSGYVRSEIERNNRKKIVEFKFSMTDKKRARINEIEIENLKELTNQFEVVLFSPQDLQIILDGPPYRRAYIDDIIKTIDGSYQKRLSEYQKIVFQRNNLLKNQNKNWFEEQLSALNIQLVQKAQDIIRIRKKMIEEVNEKAHFYHLELTNQKEQLHIAYETNVQGDMMQLLHDTLPRDLENKNTDIGPHKDDLLITINELPSRKYASQGQSRTATLALKLAELSIIEKYNETAPILLLDDVFSELDHHRANYLLKSIQKYQTIVTTNTIDEININELDAKIYRVKSGHVQDEASSSV